MVGLPGPSDASGNPGPAGLVGERLWAEQWVWEGSAGCGVQRARGAWARWPCGPSFARAGGTCGQAGAQADGGVGLSWHRVSHHCRGALQALAAHVVVLFPVLVLAEGAAVARCIAAAAGLAGLASTVPAALDWGKEMVGVGQGWATPYPQRTQPGCRMGKYTL